MRIDPEDLVPITLYTIGYLLGLRSLTAAEEPSRLLTCASSIAFHGLSILSLRASSKVFDLKDTAGLLGVTSLLRVVYVTYIQHHVAAENVEAFYIFWNFRNGLRDYPARTNHGEASLPHDHVDEPGIDGLEETPTVRRVRHRFVRNRVLHVLQLLVLYYCYETFNDNQHGFFRPIKGSDFHPWKQAYFRRFTKVTVRETLIRVNFVFEMVWKNWIVWTINHEAVSIVFVGGGVDQPEEWPPVFGSLSEAYTLKRFWGKFWHRLTQRTLLGLAKSITTHALRLSPGFLHRVVSGFLVFVLSGLCHAAVTYSVGFRCGWGLDVAWFMLNFVAIATEQVFLYLVTPLVRRIPQLSKFGWIMGYMWVFLFFFWGLPKLDYPKSLCAPRRG